jgi:gliding motility-associated lipoprotein GldH
MINGTSRYLLLVTISVTVLLFSCNKNTLFTSSLAMRGEEWKLDNVAVFKPEVSDTINSHNIYFTIRTGTSYPYQNIWLFVTTTAPSGKSITDTLQYKLADEKGKWFGRGFADVHELNLPYKTNVYFREKGIYSIKIRHGMRTESLKGVYDFGLRIDRIKN